ncbi:hypothetical protein LTR08_005156 [Meristemomyces frigidus]|nr:hypothetical protein LTR08_005156 [Meristemomyces frigidus]
MGTLTAGQPRLAEYCPHKLPTSCRLTSIPECCACADERAHSPAYSTYIDGVGFVQRGVRWQRYCWFCKEFWENRVRVSGLRSGQTRVPEVPDQTAFLERWYEFHAGYRTVTKEDGSEERVAVLGEEFREVSPGCLPRTLEEMMAGRAADDAAPPSREQRSDAETDENSGPSLEDTLDQLFQSASMEDDGQQQTSRRRADQTRQLGEAAMQQNREAMRQSRDASGNNSYAQVLMPPSSRNREYQARRIAALRRELHRMRSGIERVISGLRDLGEAVPDHSAATSRLTDLGLTLEAIDGVPSRGHADRTINSVNESANDATNVSQTDRTLASIQVRVDEANIHFGEARRSRDQAASELDLAEQEYRTSQHRVQQLRREQRSTENYLRLFGTREEMIAQGDAYESPIGGMFNRAYERFRVAEDVRQEERTLVRVLADEERAGGEEATQRLVELEGRQRDLWSVPRPATGQDVQTTGRVREIARPADEMLEEYHALVEGTGLSHDVPAAESIGVATDRVLVPSGPHVADVASEDFPRNMPDRHVAAPDAQESVELPAPESTLPTTHNADEEWREDIDHVLRHFAQTADPLAEPLVTQDDIGILRLHLEHGTLTDDYRRGLDVLLTAPETVWGSGLPAARLARSRRAGLPPVLRPSISALTFRERTDNIEVMAELFQMSAQVRRAAVNLSASEQLRMLYRLQAGQRTVADVATLDEMQDDLSTFTLANRMRARATEREASTAHNNRRESLDEQRQVAARQGDRSRQELDAQRRATQAFAVAAGRTAMRTGPTALLERMAHQDQETQAAYDRLRANGYVPDGDSAAERRLLETMYRPIGLTNYGNGPPRSESESEEEEAEEQGLDATDSGRPEPKGDGDMTVTMECRICYTQLAEIACLPCGHLVMCKWCSEMHSPVMAHDRTRPRRAAGCPVCRKGIRQKVRVFRA